MLTQKRDELISLIKKYIDNNAYKEIITAYLFGSNATGKATPLSDVDVAVLFHENVNKKDYLKLKLHHMANLSSFLRIERIDFVILNEAPSELAYNVIKEGVVVYEEEKERPQYVDFKANTFNRYFDYLPTKKMFYETLTARIREGRYGGQ